MGVLWVATNSDTDTIYELNPDDCTVLATLAHPTPGFNGAGLEMDDEGNLWTIGQSPNIAYLHRQRRAGVLGRAVAVGDARERHASPRARTQNARRDHRHDRAHARHLPRHAVRAARTRAREPVLRVPVSLVVTAYQQSANAGGSAYTDTLGDPWVADQAHTNGSWGYVQKGKVVTTTKTIAGTSDQPLFKSQRVDPYAYRFDNVPNGVYQVELRFAELQKAKLGKRLFDVIAEQTLVLPAHDITYEVGTVHGRQPHVLRRRSRTTAWTCASYRAPGSDKPLINALRVTHRPDR